jgi:hypothetical protein
MVERVLQALTVQANGGRVPLETNVKSVILGIASL